MGGRPEHSDQEGRHAHDAHVDTHIGHQQGSQGLDADACWCLEACGLVDGLGAWLFLSLQAACTRSTGTTQGGHNLRERRSGTR